MSSEMSVIARLRGTVAARTGAGLILDVGGVGYLVAVTPRVSARVGEEAIVETHLIVRADVLQLYGFATADERELFELLLGVSSVGPKVALAIVSGSTPEELRRAIVRDDTARFEAIPGIGRKTAQRVVLELKEKMTAGLAVPADASAAGSLLARDALVELGWSLVDADRALSDVDESLPVEEQVRAALRHGLTGHGLTGHGLTGQAA